MNLYKVTLYVVDFDRLGAEGIKNTLEHTRFPNDCISPRVDEIEVRDIGEWRDGHPINQSVTGRYYARDLFSKPLGENP